jgi:hypothetical protein
LAPGCGYADKFHTYGPISGNQLPVPVTSGLYIKTIMIVIMTIVSDATIWSVTFDATRGVIYDRNMAIPHVYGTGVICDDRQMTIVIVL